MSYKAVCAGLVLLLVLPGLFKLASAWRHGPADPPASAAEVAFTDARSGSPGGRQDRGYWTRHEGRLRGSATAAAAGRWMMNREAVADWQRVGDIVASAGAREQATARALGRFMTGGSLSELRALRREEVELLAAHLAQAMPGQELGALFERYLGLPAAQVMRHPDPASIVTGIYDALVGDHLNEVRPAPLMMTDACQPDGRITGQTQVLASGTRRVFAVFENSRALEGLSQVLAVWRNPDDDRMVFTEFEPVRQGTSYNYVWLEVAGGWPAGRYQVELFHPEAQSLLLASEGFTVR